MTEMLELLSKDFTTVLINVFRDLQEKDWNEYRKSLTRELETIKETQLECLELKNKIPEMKKKITRWA